MWMQVQNFYNGVTNTYKIQIGSIANGNPEDLEPQALYDLIEKVVSTSYNWHSARSEGKITADSDVVFKLTTQVEQLVRQLSKINVSSIHNEPPFNDVCDFCGGPHFNINCPGVKQGKGEQEQCDYAGYNQRNPPNPYSNTYNPATRNHPNFGWTGQRNQQEQPRYQQQQGGHYQRQPQQHYKQPVHPIKDVEQDMKTMMMQFMKQTQASIKNLETQVHHLADSSSKGKGVMPSNTEPNPKGDVMAITLRSGKETNPPLMTNKSAECVGRSRLAEKEKEQTVLDQEKPTETDLTSDNNQEEPGKKYYPPPPYVPPVPYPARLVNKKLEEQNSKCWTP
ncbi:uncharacterized protein [Euphorbia lathyris]|uniref:uncharacterized protein n=1 Tax=Euphorbia lathyris TaxID=212925 RepID=UPI003313B16E